MLQDKIDCLQKEFDKFKTNFQNKLDELKSNNKSNIKLDDIFRLICNTRAAGFEPQKIIVSTDVEETIRDINLSRGYNTYLFGIPLEIKPDGYNTIEITSKKIERLD